MSVAPRARAKGAPRTKGASAKGVPRTKGASAKGASAKGAPRTKGESRASAKGAPRASRVKGEGGAGAWFVYVLRCGDGTLYTGIARDVAARLAQHASGRGARYTRGRGPLELVAKRRCAGQGNALRLEASVKALPRDAKLDLVAEWRRARRAT